MKKTASAIVLAALAIASSGAMAGGFVSGSVGQGHIDESCDGVPSCDTTDTAFKLVGGYQNQSGFGGEIGYISFGKAKLSGYGVSGEIKATALTLGIAYQATNQESDFGLNFRFGAANVKADLQASYAGYSVSDSETNWAPYFGIGLSYAFTKAVSLVVAADFSKAEYDGAKDDVRAITLGLRFDF
ncbi:outer membrane beta-barrel protein [Sphaerotilaceae bacterium SBD11-9]